MFWDDVVLVTEQVEKYGLRKPFADLGGMNCPWMADYTLIRDPADQEARYVRLQQRPFDHIDPDYLVLNPEKGAPCIEDLPYSYRDTFGTVTCLNVLEHVQNPFRVFAAFYQIMKPDSLLILETVFMFPYHPSPADYWRFTPDALRHLADQSGFAVLECDWRMNIPADSGVVDTKSGERQLIKSVYATLTKGNFVAGPSAVIPLPQRYDRNGVPL